VGLLSFLIGPATVALAVPLFAQRERIRQLWRPIGVALLVGGTVAIVSALLIAWALGGTRETLMALAPKSATMPIALPVAERMGGPASLAAVAVAITGIAGAVLAAPLMRLLRVHDPAVRGFAIGLTAHAIGTARELQVHPTAGAFAALAMSLNGVATAVLVPLCVAAMPWL
jgi:putative effector of murein hydrolase